jgi:transposase-like protein
MVTNPTATMEVVDTGEKRDGRGRRIMPADRREELVGSWRQSGLTQAAFARREGINYTTFCSWVQQRRPESRRDASAKMRFAEVHVPASASTPGVEVRLADGTLVRGTKAQDVARVVRALRA